MLAAWGRDFTGIWSNGQAEFKTLSLTLLPDGKGILGTSIMPVVISWTANGDEIVVISDSDGRPTTLKFSYNTTTGMLVLQKSESPESVLKRISKDVPAKIDDLFPKKKEEVRYQRSTRTVPVSTVEGILQLLSGWGVEPSDPNGFWYLAIPRTEKAQSLRMHAGGGVYSIEFVARYRITKLATDPKDYSRDYEQALASMDLEQNVSEGHTAQKSKHHLRMHIFLFASVFTLRGRQARKCSQKKLSSLSPKHMLS